MRVEGKRYLVNNGGPSSQIKMHSKGVEAFAGKKNRDLKFDCSKLFTYKEIFIYNQKSIERMQKTCLSSPRLDKLQCVWKNLLRQLFVYHFFAYLERLDGEA